jgi:acetyl esterase/lipase
VTWASAARLAGAALLFLPALLTVAPPGLNALWKLSIPVKETGFFLTLPCLLLALWSARDWSSGAPARVAALLFLAAALLYAYPLVRAMETARRLEKDFGQGFGKRPASTEIPLQRHAPLVWADLLRGVPTLRAPAPETFIYSRRDGLELRLDFYGTVAGNTRKSPCVVVIHGGGWDTGKREQLPALNTWLSGAGYTVATIDYRLAPEHAYPAPVEDAAAALAFLKTHAHELGVDPARFILLGRSAGGQIALQAAYTLKDPSIKGVIAYYAPADMVFGYSLPGNPLILDSRKVMDQYLGGGCIRHPENCRAASPLEFADANSPPTLLLHGKPDVLVSYKHTLHLEDKLDSLGVPHFSVKLPWATHGYDYMFSGPGSQISLYFIERFLARVVP